MESAKLRLIAFAIAAPLAAGIIARTAFLARASVDPSTVHAFNWSAAVRSLSFWTWVILAWAGLCLALYGFDVRAERRRIAGQRDREHTAQLHALHSQINPHFLFNSLNSVSALLLDGKIAEADEMVTRLAHFLRLGLSTDPAQVVRLSTELELQRAYLSIEKIRYEEIDASFAVPSELENALVPALILQPIIENAVKYGVSSAAPPARIDVRAWSRADNLHVEVTDSGRAIPLAPAGNGIGLSNVRKRLSLIYGEEEVMLAAGRLEDGTFRVELRLPLEFE